jgi:isochorismate synthase
MSYLPNNGLWIGATPETLLSYDNQTSILKTVALAGTQKAKKTAPKEAVWKQKEIEEQALVSRYIINCFKKIRLREFRERGPKTIQAGNLWHLFTEFIVNNTEAKVKNLADKMLLLLHPTSAVCGMPLQVAKKFFYSKKSSIIVNFLAVL